MKKKIVLACSISLMLTACDQGPKEGFGTILGAIGGAAVGKAIGGKSGSTGQVVAVAAGTLAGAAIGGSVGRSLDKADRVAMNGTRYRTLEHTPSGHSVKWSNPDSGNSGSYVARPAYQNRQGQYCREYQQTITVGGETENAYGKACRQPDGDWKIVS